MSVYFNLFSTNYNLVATSSVLIGLGTLAAYHLKKIFQNSAFIFNAAHVNSPIRIKLAIASGAKINDRVDSQTPLMIAARKGHLEVVKILLDARADIDARDSFNATALIHVMLGAKSNPRVIGGYSADGEKTDVRYAKTAKKLIDARADINVQDRQGMTALIHSVDYEGSSGHLVGALLEGGADTAIEDQEGDNALMKAARKVHDSGVSVVDILCKAGAKGYSSSTQEIRDRLSISYIRHETRKRWHCLQRDYRSTRIDAEAMKRLTALIIAADASKVSMTEYLGMPAYRSDGHHTYTKQRETFEAAIALMLAAKKGDHAIVEAVLKGKIIDEVLKNVQDMHGQTALMVAAKKGCDQIVSTLVVPQGWLFSPPFLDIQDEEGRTALMLASAAGHRKVVYTLLKEGAKKKLKDYKGKTAAVHASDNGHLDQFIQSVKQRRVENILSFLPHVLGELVVDYAYKNPF